MKVKVKGMKVVILAGGYGTRISEESDIKPKPMVSIGQYPILWHIMKTYAHFGYNEFIICLGYKGYVIKEFFANFMLHTSDVEFDYTKENSMKIFNNTAEPWKVSLIETGADTMTGGRIKRIKDLIGNEPFMITYGDGVADINIDELVKKHKKSGKILTLSTIQLEPRFGTIKFSQNDIIKEFKEKDKFEEGWINGGYMVAEPEFFNYLIDDSTVLEKYPMTALAKEGQLAAYKHTGFWHPMDTLREKQQLSEMWETNNAPWKVW
jgi:glucose-1-phosphate cytidylyltransferase